MAINTSTLRPGLLVSLKSSVRGNVTYRRRDVVQEHVTKDGKAEAKWETERTITDPQEHEEAVKVRAAARVCITSVCAQSAFGLLCPESDEGELEKALVEANKLIDAFNNKAKLTRVGIFVLTGRIAPDDVEAVKAINSEIRDLLSDMEDGLKNLDVKAVREAANKAKNIGSMLTPDAQTRIKMAIEAARSSARRIVKAGEQTAMEIDSRTIRTIVESRTAFLDIDEPSKKIARPRADGRALDLPTDEFFAGSKRKAKGEKARSLDLN